MSRLVLFVLVLMAGSTAIADTYDSSQRTHTFAIESDALNETRQVIVRTPPKYNADEKRYPVVYVLDGEWNFEFVASYLDYMADNEVYPQMIVTGVTNVNRNRDYVPRADANFSDTGGADDFLAFVKNEWIKDVEGRYPASGDRIIVGHSFGGVFALHAFFKEPSLFAANIALGASAWIGDGVLYEEADALFEGQKNVDGFVYMAVGEGDGGPTVPSSKQLAEIFKDKAPASLEWTFSITPQTDHFKNVPSGLHDAFMAFFPAWDFHHDVQREAERNGAEGVNDWFDRKRLALGFRFQPAWFDMGVLAMQLARDGRGEAALALIDQLLAFYPQSAYVADFSRAVNETLGRYEIAEGEAERAIALTRAQDLHPNAIHLERLERALDRLQGLTDAP